ncbi:MAG: translation initiation factor [Planctomycetota bacterium]
MAKKRSTRKTSGDGWSLRSGADELPLDKVRVSVAPGEQHARVHLDKRAKGKVVTVIEDLVLTDGDLKQLGKALKNACGTGGTIRPGAVELQGDCRERALSWLNANGWGVRS